MLPYAEDLERAAELVLDEAVAGFISGAAGHQRTAEANRAAFDRYRLRPRVLVDVGDVSLTTELFDVSLDAPILIAPMGTHQVLHPDGELASAVAARTLGLGIISSTASSRTLEEVAAHGPQARWFQLYVFRDRAVVADLAERAAAAGYGALCVTVDTPVLGDRRIDRRTRFTPDPSIRWRNLDRSAAGALPQVDDGTAVARFIGEQLDPSLTWDDLRWLQERSPLPIVIKGVLHPQDAVRAVEAGVAGLVVSNHGGRQLDRCLASLEALPAVVDAVGGEVPVLLDGGVRDAPDIAIALALGATAVTVGRPVLWALAAGGPALVHAYLEELVLDLRRTMRVLGCPRVRDLDRDALVAFGAGGDRSI